MSKKPIERVSDFMIYAAKNPKDLKSLLADILSPAEIDDISNRIQILESLFKHQTQRDVSEKLGVSISKVTRGSHVAKHGSAALKKMFKNSK